MDDPVNSDINSTFVPANFFQLLDHISWPRKVGMPVWYRGHQKSEWQLQSVLDRRHLRHEMRSLLHEFRLLGGLRYSSPPDIHNPMQWLILGRHYGLATPLLDWTRLPLMALFFACSYRPESGPATLWTLFPQILNDLHLGLPGVVPIYGQEAVQLLNRITNDPDLSDDQTLAVVPAEFDLRMMLQSSTFTIHGNSIPLEEQALMPSASNSPFLKRVLIPEDVKLETAEYLEALGFNESTVFPDLEHLASHLDRYYSIQKPRFEEFLGTSFSEVNDSE